MENEIKERKVYSESFKQMVISEVKAGLSVVEVSSKYDICGSMTVYKWCTKYNIKPTKRINVDVPQDIRQRIEMAKEKANRELRKETDRIKLLEYELALYKKLVEIAKRDYNLDLLKKPDTKLFKK